MTKKEQQALEEALTVAALRSTGDAVLPDVPPPEYGSNVLSKGWAIIGVQSDYPRIELACSSSDNHGTGQQDKTTSQGSRSLYSTRLRALKALRHEVEKDCMRRLRKVDRMIEEELKLPKKNN